VLKSIIMQIPPSINKNLIIRDRQIFVKHTILINNLKSN